MTDRSGELPPAWVVEAFGGDAMSLARLPGGQGMSWRAGRIVLKPTRAEEPIGWSAAVLAQVSDSDDYRVARPVPATDGAWIVDGWSATAWAEGVHVPGRWEDELRVSAVFHAALARIHAGPLPARDDPWTTGMRVAWGALEASGRFRDVEALRVQLAPLLNRRWEGSPPQVIHGDLGGNIIYAGGLPPAVIDFSPHMAPAPFADAIIIADGIAWEGAPTELAARFVTSCPAGAQLLARAVLYRVIAVAELVDDAKRVAAEIEGYRPVLDIAASRA